MQPVETIHVEAETVACDGGDGPLGHPRVYLHMRADGRVDCPYCGRRFVFGRAAVRSTGMIPEHAGAEGVPRIHGAV